MLNALRAIPSTVCLFPVLALPAAAQSTCFESASSDTVSSGSWAAALGDLDGDGHLDLVTAPNGSVVLARGRGDGTFEPPVPIAQLHADRLHVADFDGDARLDVLVVTGLVRLLRNGGQGTFAVSPVHDVPVRPDVSLGDIDGDGDLDLVAVTSLSNFGQSIYNLGGGTFGSEGFSLPYAADGGTALADLNGDGRLDFIAVSAETQVLMLRVSEGLGHGFRLLDLQSGSVPTHVAAADLDGDGFVDLALLDLGNRDLSTWRGAGAGWFEPRLDRPFGAGVLGRLHVLDLDRDGDLDLYAPIVSVGGPAGRLGVTHFLNDGTFAFPATTALASSRPVVGVLAGDLDQDGDVDLVSVEAVTGTTAVLEVRRSCLAAGRPVCAGDGSASACPCANESPSGSQRGCLNGTGVGAALRAAGSLLLADDACVLEAQGLPSTTTATFFQGASAIGGGQGAVFGDGLLCATGSVRRLATKATTTGSTRYPEAGEPSLSVRGQVAAPGARTYQVLYRNAASFCTPASFNLSNGLAAEWR